MPGMHLLRTGDEKGARVALERAFKGDALNQTTFNQLDLLDTIDKFVTITDGDIIMRLDPAEVGVMREYAMPLAKQALQTLQKLYEFKVSGPNPHRDVPQARSRSPCAPSACPGSSARSGRASAAS